MLFFMQAMATRRNSGAAGAREPVDTKTAYEQLCSDFRGLNTILWQMPVIFTTLTGGLWYAVASLDLTDYARSALLVFAGLANLIMIAALIRLRFVMERLRTKIVALDQRPSPGGSYFTVGALSLLLLLTAVGSFVASACPGKWFLHFPSAQGSKP
jgi:hypothetical protein